MKFLYYRGFVDVYIHNTYTHVSGRLQRCENCTKVCKFMQKCGVEQINQSWINYLSDPKFMF